MTPDPNEELNLTAHERAERKFGCPHHVETPWNTTNPVVGHYRSHDLHTGKRILNAGDLAGGFEGVDLGACANSLTIPIPEGMEIDEGRLRTKEVSERIFNGISAKARELDAQDFVNHPAHYNSGKVEVIEAIEDWKMDYHLGNAIKYIARAGKKDPRKFVEDLEKAIWYVNRKIKLIQGTAGKPDETPIKRVE